MVECGNAEKLGDGAGLMRGMWVDAIYGSGLAEALQGPDCPLCEI